MKRFTRCPICGASVKTENMPEHTRRVHAKSIDSGEVAGAKRPLMTRIKIGTYDRQYAGGYRFVEEDEFEQAIRILRTIPKDYPDIADVYSLRAIPYTKLKRYDDALIYFEKPYLDAETYLALEDRFHDGVTYMKKKDWDLAIAEFEYAVSVDQASEKAYGNLGIAYLFKGKFDEAEQCFEKALEINPEYPPATRNLALLENVREKASKDHEYLKELEDYMREGYF